MTRPAWRLLLAGGALIAVLLVVTNARRGNDEAAGPAPASNTARTTTNGTRAPQSPVADLRLDRLHRENEELTETARDPFRFRPKAPPPAPPAPRPVAPSPPPVVVPVAPPAPAGPPPPPPIPLKFIGLLDAPGRTGQMAILSDSRGNVFYGKEGDIIEGRYRVLKVGPDAAELSYTDGRGRQTIRLGQ
jgi:hypothetical protein